MEQVAELTGHVGIIYSLQVIEAPAGGTRLFSACYDKTLRVCMCASMYVRMYTCMYICMYGQGRIDPPKAGRGHATLVHPV